MKLLKRFSRKAAKKRAATKARAEGSGTDPFAFAMENGQTELARDAVHSGAPIDGTYANGKSAMTWAIDLGLDGVVSALARRGVDPFAADSHGHTPFGLLVEAGNGDLLGHVLAGAPSVDRLLPGGMSALSWSISTRRESLALALIERGADPDLRNVDDTNPLLYALTKRLDKVATALVERGAKLDYKVADTAWMPLHYAVHNRLERTTAAMLAKGADPAARTETGDDPFTLALTGRSERLAEALMADERDWNQHTKDGRTLLTYAIDQGMAKTVADLIAKGASVSFAEQDGTLPYTKAVRNGNEAMALLIAEHCNEFDFRFANGKTPLTQAMDQGMEKLALALLNKGASAELRQANGVSPLTKAIALRNTPIAKALIAKGAKVDFAYKEGDTGLLYAIDRGLEDVAVAMLDAGADPRRLGKGGRAALHTAMTKRLWKVAGRAVDKGAATNVLMPDGKSAIVTAILANQSGLALRMANSGASTTALDDKGFNAITASLDLKNAPLTQQLIDRGKHFNQRMPNGETLLTYAIKSRNGALVQSLLKAGADPTRVNRSGQSPIELAQRLDDPVLMVALTEATHAENTRIAEADKLADHLAKDVGSIDAGALKLSIDVRHLGRDSAWLKQIAEQAIPAVGKQPLKNILKQIVGIFDRINFSDPSGEAYVDPAILEEDGRQYTVGEARNLLIQFVSDIRHRAQIHGSEDNARARERNLADMEAKFRRVFAGLTEAPAYTVGMVLGPVAMSTKHCLTGRMDALDLAETTLAAKSGDFYKLPEQVARVLKNHRKQLIQELFNKAPAAERRHGAQWWLHRVGKPFGVPEAVHYTKFAFQRDLYLGKNFNMSDDIVYDRFFQHYNADGMAAELMRAVNAQIDDPQNADPQRSIKFGTLQAWADKVHVPIMDLLDEDFHLTRSGAQKILLGLRNYLSPEPKPVEEPSVQAESVRSETVESSSDYDSDSSSVSEI